MRLPLALLLLAAAAAAHDAPPTARLTRAAHRRRAGLAADLRTALRSIFKTDAGANAERPTLQRRNQQILDHGRKLHCVALRPGEQNAGGAPPSAQGQGGGGGGANNAGSLVPGSYLSASPSGTSSPVNPPTSSSLPGASGQTTSTGAAAPPPSSSSTQVAIPPTSSSHTPIAPPSTSSSPTALAPPTTSSSPTAIAPPTTSSSPTQIAPPPTASPTQSAPGPTSSWKVANSWTGAELFGWNWVTGPDESTSGIVQYVDAGTAQASGLASVNSAGNFIMAVEMTQSVPNTRNSIRLVSNVAYTGGLVVLDAVHMPTGCGTWPAFWSNGPDWPNHGEIDVLEGVNDFSVNQATIHTSLGCKLATTDSGSLGMTGSLIGGPSGTDCSIADQGCGVVSNSTVSYGAAFNNNGGGVYAMRWDNSGVSVWFFPRAGIPGDIADGAPTPEKWGTPMANFPAANCAPFTFFSQHNLIFDTTLCGAWAGAAWAVSGTPGQEQSCAVRTGVADCVTFVRTRGDAFANAYWEVKSVKIYQTS